MAPSPDDDGPPKAPDKRGAGGGAPAGRKPAADGGKQENDIFNLNDRDLKHLLEEAVSYKSPKDRQGKSELFNNLLTNAENELRNARATSASGPEKVRHYNKRATKRHGKGGRKASSVSENLTHSGSLNNLTKEDLFEETIRQRPKKTVSARQTEGGSLPCNVNVAAFDQYDFRAIREMGEIKTTISIVDEHEMAIGALARKRTEAEVIESFNNLSSKAKKSQKIIGVDDRIPVSVLDQVPTVDVVEYKKATETTVTNSFLPVNIGGGLTFNGRATHRDEKRVDENCNAVPSQQQLADGRKIKAKKRPSEKNVTVWESSKVTGHRGDIIHDVDKLMDYIDGTDVRKDAKQPSSSGSGGGGKSNVPKKHVQKQHIFDDGKSTVVATAGKKQRARTKAKAGAGLHKSNSLEEISTTKIEDFEFLPGERDDGAVVLRQAKGSSADRPPRERRSWGTSEVRQSPVQVQSLYANASAENLETADFRVVTKKKKSKRQQQRRNSLSGRKTSQRGVGGELGRPATSGSPEPPRRKSAVSVPHSERSNDSSDVDSVHSLPVDAADLSREMPEDESGFPISYADIAKNNNNNNNNNNSVNGSVEKGKSNNSNSVVSNNNNNNNNINNSKSAVGKKEKVPEIGSVSYTANFPSIVSKEQGRARNPIAEIQTWPAIPKNSIVVNQKKMQNHFKNAKNAEKKAYDNYSIPINIPDVQSIEKEIKNSAKLFDEPIRNSGVQCETMTIDSVDDLVSSNDRTMSNATTSTSTTNANVNSCNVIGVNSSARPAVVILSAGAGEKEASGITFGFDIEQLLSNDVCANFMARFVQPPRLDDVGRSFNLDKIVNYVGIAWEDVVKETTGNGKVQYYTESL